MPRKRPHELRPLPAQPLNEILARHPGAAVHEPAPVRGHERHRALARRLGHDTASALVTWSVVCRRSRRTLRSNVNDWAEIIGPDARDRLEEALATLPQRHARHLARELGRLDARFEARTLQNPWTDPDLPWWYRRTGRE